MRNLFVGLIGCCMAVLLLFAGCNEQKTVARYDVNRADVFSADARLDTSFAAAVPVQKSQAARRSLPGFLLPDTDFESTVSVLALETASFIVDTTDVAMHTDDAIRADQSSALTRATPEPITAEMLVEVAAAGGSPVETAVRPAARPAVRRVITRPAAPVAVRKVITRPVSSADVAWPVAEGRIRGWVETSGKVQRNDTDGPELESTRGGVVAPGQYMPQPLAEILISEAPGRGRETSLRSRKALDKNLARLGWVESRWSRSRARGSAY